jgi:hypothetical protein
MNKYDSDLVRLNFLMFIIKLKNVCLLIASLSSMWKRLLYKMNGLFFNIIQNVLSMYVTCRIECLKLLFLYTFI